MNKNTENRKEEYILLDLFTVILRYRRLIIGITICSVIIAIAGYFVYPTYQNKKSQYLVRSTFFIRQQAISLIPQDIRNFINNADVILDSLRAAEIESFNGISLIDEVETLKALYAVNEHLISNIHLSGGMLQIIKSDDSETVATTVNIFFRYNDIKITEAFIPALFNQSNKRIESFIRADIEAIVSNYEQLMSIPNPSQAIQEIISRNHAQYVLFVDILNGDSTILMQLGEPVVMKESSLEDFKKRYEFIGIIIVLAGFFVSLFLAFTFNVINNIKNDEEAMKKIRDALGKSNDK